MKHKFYIPSKERLGLLFLILLIILSHVISIVYEKTFGFSDIEKTEIISDIIKKEKKSNTDSNIHITSQIQNLPQIDLNNVEIEKLGKYGFSKYASENLKKYRDAGGAFLEPEDLLKIYGVDSTRIMASIELFKFPNKEETKAPKSILKNKTIEPEDTPIIQSTNPDQEKYDPNHASHETLLSHGFSKFAANNLISYRERGGKINNDSDLLKIYGFDSSKFASITIDMEIVPNLQIIEPDQLLMSETTFSKNLEKDFLSQQIDINIASQDQLMRLSGVGPVISKGIIEYRKRLGGYYKKEQLLEVYAVTSELLTKIESDIIISEEIDKIYIPSLSFKAVLKHPYIDYETTKILKNISILNFDEELSKLIDEGTIDQELVPYLYLSNPLIKNN